MQHLKKEAITFHSKTQIEPLLHDEARGRGY